MSTIDKKALLISTRMRFAPESQPIKDTAIEKILEQNMLLADQDKGLSFREIEQLFDLYIEKRLSFFGRKTIDKALKRLIQQKRLILVEGARETLDRYKLTQSALRECEATEKVTLARNEKIIKKLFEKRITDYELYAQPFFDCISIVFSRLGEAYVRLLKSDITLSQLIKSPDIQNAIQLTIRKNAYLDSKIFETSIYDFFTIEDPDFAAVKWNMAQNYFIARVIGLHSAEKLLSREIFSGSTFYLDTNVIINLLEPKSRHYRSMQALIEMCKSIDIDMCFCKISLDELNRVVNNREEMIKSIGDKIPEELSHKIPDLFYRLYIQIKQTGKDVDFKQLFSNFRNARALLKRNYPVSEVDNKWFDDNAESVAILNLAEKIRRNAERKRYRRKSKNSSIHDALLIKWMRNQQSGTKEKTWLVTLDTSFPDEAVADKKDHSRSCVITLDALLHWISPLVFSPEMEDHIATVFSEAISHQLLPQENIFTLNDFYVFAGMEWEIKELPAKDVEDFIRYLRINAPNLNPGYPIDREKIAHEMSKFLVDPGRKYKEGMHSLQKKYEQQEKQIAGKSVGFEETIMRQENTIADLKRRIEDSEKGRRLKRQKVFAYVRLLIATLVFFAVEIAFVFLANNFAEGKNILQKVIKFWPLFVAGIPIYFLLSWFLVGKKGLISLGWPFSKLMKGK